MQLKASWKWLLLGALLGWVIPARYTARRYLLRQLSLYGVDLSRLPDRCIDEFVDNEIHSARLVAQLSRKHRKTELVDHLDGLAPALSYALDSRRRADPEWESIVDDVRRVLTRHGVDFPEPP